MRRAYWTGLLAAVLLMTGCAGGGGSSNLQENTQEQNTQEQNTQERNDAETSEEDLVEATEIPEEYRIYLDMVNRSLLSMGNNYRMKQVIERAEAGEDITIAYIGGSITEGYNAGTQEIYAKLSYEYFADNYGSRDTVHYVNAGLSGTPSTLGLIRSDRDVFEYEPDILFIEFAVNDSKADARAYDSLIMKALRQENQPAVVLLFSVIESGYTMQDDMAATGFYYELPMISVKNAIWPEIEAKRMTWSVWSNDQSHPNEYGQSVYAEFIRHYYQVLASKETDEPVELPEKLCLRQDLTDMKMMDKNNLTVDSVGSFVEKSGLSSFTEGWVKEASDTANEPFTLTFEGTFLYLVYKDTNSSNFGTAEVYVDGELVKTLEGNSSDGWNNPVAECVFRQDEAASHTVEIRMAEGDEDKEFAILCFGFVE